MANRVVATFARREVDALGPARWSQVQGLLLPALNLLAGEIVYFAEMEGSVYALASAAPDPVHASDCALNNGPAMASRPCDCGAEA